MRSSLQLKMYHYVTPIPFTILYCHMGKRDPKKRGGLPRNPTLLCRPHAPVVSMRDVYDTSDTAFLIQPHVDSNGTVLSNPLLHSSAMRPYSTRISCRSFLNTPDLTC